jgi:hypothetical protein
LTILTRSSDTTLVSISQLGPAWRSRLKGFRVANRRPLPGRRVVEIIEAGKRPFPKQLRQASARRRSQPRLRLRRQDHNRFPATHADVLRHALLGESDYFTEPRFGIFQLPDRPIRGGRTVASRTEICDKKRWECVAGITAEPRRVSFSPAEAPP